MVLCVVVGCSKRSGRDKDVSFYRIPKVITGKGEAKEKLSRRRRAGFLSAIMRADLTEKVLANDRICSRHFLSGKPAELLDEKNPDWLPTLHLGNSKEIPEDRARAAEERWARTLARQARSEAAQMVSQDEDVDIVVDANTQTTLTSDCIDYHERKISVLINEIESLKADIDSLKAPFTERKFLENHESVKFYTGLPKFNVLKTV